MNRSLSWYRYRMFSGVAFGVLGIVIAVQLATKPGPFVSKLGGYGLVVVAIALAAQRVVAYLKARTVVK